MAGYDTTASTPIASFGDASITGDGAFQLSGIVSISGSQPAQTLQLLSIISITEIIPDQTKQLSAEISVSGSQPGQTLQYAIIISVKKKRKKPAYYPPLRIAQATPLYVVFDAPTTEEKDF